MDLEQMSPQQVATHREMERKSNDRIRIYNPTDEDFAVWNNGLKWIIPNKSRDVGYGDGQYVCPRYIANTYLTHMTDHILTKQMDEAADLENEKRREKGQPEMTKYAGGDLERFQMSWRIDDPAKRQPIMREIWLGVEEEYGIDEAVEEQKVRDERPSDEKFIESLDFPVRKAPEMPKNGVSENLGDKSLFDLRKMAREKGIDVKLTDKKLDLIRELEG